MKRSSALLLPAGLLLVAFVLLQRLPELPQSQRELLGYAPYLSLCVGLALSLAFNRGRAFLSLLLAALLYLVLRSQLREGLEQYGPRTLYLFLSVLVPVNLTLFCFMRERGVFSHAGKLRLAFLALQILAVYWVVRFPGDYAPVPELIGRPLSGAWPGLFLPHASQLLFLLAFVLIGIRALRGRHPLDLGLLGALVALGVSISGAQVARLPELFVTAAALLITVALLQDSHSMAFSDELTGLPSRRAFNEQVMGLPRRFCVAMLDVDHFKRCNDSFGHDVGDQVLKMVGSRLASVGGGGRAYRYGGEEFAVLFPGKDVKEVVPHLEELRRGIELYQLRIRGVDRPKEGEKGRVRRTREGGDGQAVSVTVSVGVAASSEARRSPREVIGEADRALYRAKQQGRNRVVS